MLEDPDDLAIVQTIIDLAHNLRLSVLAEGVETADIGNRLLEMGCQGAQGYHYARPMPADEVIPWMERPRPARRRVLAPVAPRRASHASIA